MLKFPAIITASSSPTIVSFADGTPAELAAMLAAHDAGDIDIMDYWSLGDKRTISHLAMAATNVGETHAAQNRSWVLMDTGTQSGYVFSDNTPVHFVVGCEDCFDETGYMNSTNTNAGSWDSSARRTWCNNELPASLDEDTRTLFKPFKVITASENNSDVLTTSIDWFALFAECEILGSATYSRTAEASALTQVEWFKTAANRIKKVNGTNDIWWERSPRANNAIAFCSITTAGAARAADVANTVRGLAPFGCI